MTTIPKTLEVAKSYFDLHCPGLVYKVRTVQGGPLNEPTDQIIVRADSIPNFTETRGLQKPEDLKGRVAFNDVTSAIYNATGGVSTFTISKSDWLEMCEIQWAKVTALIDSVKKSLQSTSVTKPQTVTTSDTTALATTTPKPGDTPATSIVISTPASTRTSWQLPDIRPLWNTLVTYVTTNPFTRTKVVDVPTTAQNTTSTTTNVSTIIKDTETPPPTPVKVEDLVLAVREILTDNGLSFISLFLPEKQKDGIYQIFYGHTFGLTQRFSEDEQIKLDLIIKKIREESGGKVLISPIPIKK